MSTEIEKNENASSEISVSKEQLKNLILLNKQLAGENDRYKKATASAVNRAIALIAIAGVGLLGTIIYLIAKK